MPLPPPAVLLDRKNSKKSFLFFSMNLVAPFYLISLSEYKSGTVICGGCPAPLHTEETAIILQAFLLQKEERADLRLGTDRVWDHAHLCAMSVYVCVPSKASYPTI